MTVTSQDIINRGRAAAMLLLEPVVQELFDATDRQLWEATLDTYNGQPNDTHFEQHIRMALTFRTLARELSQMRHAGDAEQKRLERNEGTIE
jgi:hypothetical protein